MPFNEAIDARIRKAIASWRGTESKKMFGGVCHLLGGNMFCGVYKDYLILRLGEHRAAEALRSKHTRPFDITGKPMKGWVMVEPEGFSSDEMLKTWLEEAREFTKTLPKK
jgi:TfoX/Sxy family transcriptional regulator of competence genes